MQAFLLDALSTPFSDALGIFAIGMITIFLVLSLVVISGNALIYFSNRFLSPKVEGTSSEDSAVLTSISPATLSAIVATVEFHTQGKGSIQSIKKSL